MDKVAFLNSQITCAMIEAMGMQARNKIELNKGMDIIYNQEDFLALIDKYGLGHNSVITYLND